MRILLLLAASLSAAALRASEPAHPLEPLTPDELQAAADSVRADKRFPQGALFPLIALKEPPKDEVLRFEPGAAFRREAAVVVLDRAANKTYEAAVDLRTRRVSEWRLLPGKQPLVLVAEYDEVPKLVKADARWQAAMRKRGITDFAKVWVDTWAMGLYPEDLPPEQRKLRLLRGISYLQEGTTNFYGRPIEGVVAVVDMTHQAVLSVTDSGVVPTPARTQELDEAAIGPQRADVKPLKIAQPDGPSFKVEGGEVLWQKWRFRFALHPREGLVLYQVRYEDEGKPRSILYRAALSETVVPYGDPDPNWAWRNAFDEGEYGMGRLASHLQPEVDAPSNARYFDAAFSDDFGKPYVFDHAVALYERDGGYLWKHYDIYSGTNQVRRARELVLSFVAAIGNYDYTFSWVFHQDGELDSDVGLTGIMLPKGVADAALGAGHSGHFGHPVAAGVIAPHHQHFFNFRLDLDVDGAKNSVAELDSRALPAGKGNPFGNAILMEERPLATARAARRDHDVKAARRWLVYNPEPRGPLGYKPGYALLPLDYGAPFIASSSPIRRRAGFVDHAFWATRYHDGELYAAGTYPNQSAGGEGLSAWAARDESLDGQDVVAWYTFGITHIPRPEEWPVMTMAHTGFRLVPVGFFPRNPGLDVPQPKP